jgi:peptidoglycan/xylan/chitin deacetylase (PgdA/CDA1 family)
MAPEVSPQQKSRRRCLILGLLALLAVGLFLAAGGHRALERAYQSNLPVWDRPDRSIWMDRLEAAAAAPAHAILGGDYGPDSYRRPLIALTFDDGPYPLYTTVLLATLKEHQVKATFFLIGHRMQEFPALTRLIAEDGHEIANHTFDHRREGELGPGELEKELLDTEEVTARVCGVRPHLFRPAGGNMSPEGIATVKGLGYTLVDYTVNPGDWWVRSSEDLLKGTFRGRSREGVVLLHTGNLPLVRALPVYIETMRAKGFRFVTVSELVEAVDSPLPVSPRLKPGEGAGVLPIGPS